MRHPGQLAPTNHSDHGQPGTLVHRR
jgi:hypothetical protein